MKEIISYIFTCFDMSVKFSHYSQGNPKVQVSTLYDMVSYKMMYLVKQLYDG